MGEDSINDIVLMSDKGDKFSVYPVKFNECNQNEDNHTPIFCVPEKTYSLKFNIIVKAFLHSHSNSYFH